MNIINIRTSHVCAMIGEPQAKELHRYRGLIKTPDLISERLPQFGGLSVCAVCCGALSLIGT
jgi:hypothetical protein